MTIEKYNELKKIYKDKEVLEYIDLMYQGKTQNPIIDLYIENFVPVDITFTCRL